MTIRWITPLLGTGPALQVRGEKDINVIDVRDLVDKAGNKSDAVLEKINEGCASLHANRKTVVCCDYGISRSNAIAVGILAKYESIPFEIAVRRVLAATGEKEIKASPLQAVRKVLDQGRAKSAHQKLRILITGGSGFLGKPIGQNLSSECDVVTLGSKELDLRHGSTQLDLIAGEKEIDCIIHLANPRVYTSNIAIGDTLTMLRNVLDVCTTRDIKLIYLSSWEVYSGYRASHLRADEVLPLLPKGPYAETKYLCEMMIEHSRRMQGLRCTMLRSSPVYGPGSDKPKFIYNFIDKIKQSRPIVTHRYNNALPALDLLYIDDLVEAVVKATGKDFCGNLNIGTGVITSTYDIAEKLSGFLGKKTDISSTPIDSDTACIAMDNGKAQEVLGWQSTMTLEEGLKIIVKNN